MDDNKIIKKKEFLSINEVCDLLSISRTQFWRLRKAGKISNPAIETPLRWRRSQFESVA